MKEFKVIYSSEYLDLVEVDGMTGIKTKKMSVAIMPYSVDEHGLINEIGFLREYNPFRYTDYSLTLITGTVESKEQDLITTAIRELKEESGYICPDSDIDRWIYLGNFYPYKDSNMIIPTFAVDVSNLEKTEPQGDGSKKEKLSTFYMIPANEAIATDELLPLATYLRLFNYIYSKTVQNLNEPIISAK